MTVRSMDTSNRAQDLASTILSSSTPPQIFAAIAAVSSFLRKHASDQSRPFFSLAFPSLICRLFGFDDSASHSSWIDQAAADPDLSGKLFDLLSPQGILISSIASVDRHSLVRYVFPTERLPEWIRFLLQNQDNFPTITDICSILKNRAKDGQLQLNVFEYYIFWFAYYPVSRGTMENSDSGSTRKSQRSRLESWTSSLPSIIATNRRSAQKPECNLYLRLLYGYLRAFVPNRGLGSCQPYRSSLLHYSSSYDGSAFVQAEFFLYTLIHFWMVDNDFSPFPVNLYGSGILSPFRALISEIPPTPGLGDVLRLLVKYVNCGLGDERRVYDESPVRKASGRMHVDKDIGSRNLVMQRPMYRFILRSFLFCPLGASFKNATQVFSLWVNYMTPWRTSLDDLLEFEEPGVRKLEYLRKENQMDGGSNGEGKEGSRGCGYMPVWESYVASNYLFYSSLVVHFIGFAHKFLHTNVDTVVQMVSKVLNVLTSSKELMDFLHYVDAAYHSNPSGSSPYHLDNIHKYVPSIREQLQDWEDGLCENDADGSFLHENWNTDLRLFSDGEDGARNLLKLFVLRAQHEIRTISGDLQALDSIRSQMNVLFGGPIGRPNSPNPSEKPYDIHPVRDEVFTPKHPGVGKRTWADVKYRGDWMRRPISDTEVAWLARLLIRLSDHLNEALGLDQVDSVDSAGPTYVQVSQNEAEPKDAVAVVESLRSCLSLFFQAVVGFMRVHGMRINLRLLASTKFMMFLVAYAFVFAVKKFVWAAIEPFGSS